MEYERLEALGIKIVDQNVGEGASATVHRGEVADSKGIDSLPTQGTPVAVKEYKSSILEVPGQIERVRQEAAVGKTINSPHVVRVYDALLPDDEDPRLLPHNGMGRR